MKNVLNGPIEHKIGDIREKNGIHINSGFNIFFSTKRDQPTYHLLSQCFSLSIDSFYALSYDVKNGTIHFP